MTLLEMLLLVAAGCLAVFAVTFAITWFVSRGERQPVMHTSAILAFIPFWIMYRWLYWGDSWDDLAVVAALGLAAAAGVHLGGRLAIERPSETEPAVEQAAFDAPGDSGPQANEGSHP